MGGGRRGTRPPPEGEGSNRQYAPLLEVLNIEDLNIQAQMSPWASGRVVPIGSRGADPGRPQTCAEQVILATAKHRQPSTGPLPVFVTKRSSTPRTDSWTARCHS